MSKIAVVHPDYIRVLERKPGGWLLKTGTMFYKRLPIAVDFQDFELLYGISKQQVITELFRLNGGALGYYLADLRHKKYYYCGIQSMDIRNTLLRLGYGSVEH